MLEHASVKLVAVKAEVVAVNLEVVPVKVMARVSLQQRIVRNRQVVIRSAVGATYAMYAMIGWWMMCGFSMNSLQAEILRKRYFMDYELRRQNMIDMVYEDDVTSVHLITFEIMEWERADDIIPGGVSEWGDGGQDGRREEGFDSEWVQRRKMGKLGWWEAGAGVGVG
ncbi:hypothetical protein LXL04_019368 [Taraxacum kok-saghyz]